MIEEWIEYRKDDPATIFWVGLAASVAGIVSSAGKMAGVF